MKCSKCGMEVSRNSKICNHCGHDLNEIYNKPKDEEINLIYSNFISDDFEEEECEEEYEDEDIQEECKEEYEDEDIQEECEDEDIQDDETYEEKNLINSVGITPKSKSLYVLLVLLGGIFGIHNFYLGYYKKGVAKLILTMIGLQVISYIWATAEFFAVLYSKNYKDSKGVLLTK